MLTAARLRDLMDYDPETGVMTLKVRRGGCLPGRIVGCRHHSGYTVATIEGKQYRLHRLAWLYVTGEWPIGDLDHKDRDRSNNKFANLRNATDSQNGANTGLLPANTTGLKGVTYVPRRRKFQSQIRENKQRRWLGYFDTAEQAHEAYSRALCAFYGEYARLA